MLNTPLLNYQEFISKLPKELSKDECVRLFEKEEKIEEEKVLQKKKQEEFQNCGVPKRYWNESFETYEAKTKQDEENLLKVKNFSELKNNDKVLLLIGSKGRGKTHLGCSILRNMQGIFIQSDEMIFKYDSSQQFEAEKNRAELMNIFSTVTMLVIDEVGRSINQKKEDFLLNFILRRRYENFLPTVLISNLSKRELMKKLGEAVVDRLRETCICIEFFGESYRPQKRNVNL